MAMASVAQRTGSFTRPVMKSMKASPAIEPPALSGSGMNSGANLSGANPSAIAAMAPMGAMEKSPLAGITGTANGPVAPTAPSNVVSDVVPQVISHPAPEYPFLARQTHTQGDVAVEVVINKAGNVANATVITGPAVFRDAALQAVRQWKYQPLGGQAMMAKTLVTLRFRM
jgi:protein TonB